MFENLSDKEYLNTVAKALKNTKREGWGKDGPEGNRYITISDTMANDMAERLKLIAERM